MPCRGPQAGYHSGSPTAGHRGDHVHGRGIIEPGQVPPDRFAVRFGPAFGHIGVKRPKIGFATLAFFDGGDRALKPFRNVAAVVLGGTLAPALAAVRPPLRRRCGPSSRARSGKGDS